MMHPALVALFDFAATKAVDKVMESVDEVMVKNLPPDADILLISPQAWLEKRRAERRLRIMKLDIEKKVDRLILILRAMYELTIERSKLSQEDLLNKTRELGLFHRSFAKEIESIARKCAKCGRKTSGKYKFKRCIYCGSSEFLD